MVAIFENDSDDENNYDIYDSASRCGASCQGFQLHFWRKASIYSSSHMYFAFLQVDDQNLIDIKDPK